MTSSTEDSKTIHYSNKNNTTALGIIGQYEELKIASHLPEYILKERNYIWFQRTRGEPREG